MLCDKRGQIGETMTWIIATIIIIVILAVAIFIVSSGFKSSKKFESKEINQDLLVTKSLLGYLLSNDVYNELKNQESLGEETSANCKLAKEVLDLTANKYKFRWAGVVDSKDEPDTNDCFYVREWFAGDFINSGDLFIKIKLKDNMYLEANLDEEREVDE